MVKKKEAVPDMAARRERQMLGMLYSLSLSLSVYAYTCVQVDTDTGGGGLGSGRQ